MPPDVISASSGSMTPLKYVASQPGIWHLGGRGLWLGPTTAGADGGTSASSAQDPTGAGVPANTDQSTAEATADTSGTASSNAAGVAVASGTGRAPGNAAGDAAVVGSTAAVEAGGKVHGVLSSGAEASSESMRPAKRVAHAAPIPGLGDHGQQPDGSGGCGARGTPPSAATSRPSFAQVCLRTCFLHVSRQRSIVTGRESHFPGHAQARMHAVMLCHRNWTAKRSGNHRHSHITSSFAIGCCPLQMCDVLGHAGGEKRSAAAGTTAANKAQRQPHRRPLHRGHSPQLCQHDLTLQGQPPGQQCLVCAQGSVSGRRRRCGLGRLDRKQDPCAASIRRSPWVSQPNTPALQCLPLDLSVCAWCGHSIAAVSGLI